MEILRTILTVIYVIDCIALTVVVLMQEGKQQGLGAIAGISDTYWGKKQKPFCRRNSDPCNKNHGSSVYCTVGCIKHEFLAK